ncbi:Hypothetical protein FKW44_022350, partial [Caligus rogercresseyi]
TLPTEKKKEEIRRRRKKKEEGVCQEASLLKKTHYPEEPEALELSDSPVAVTITSATEEEEETT